MVTVADAVEALVLRSPLLFDGLRRGLLNVSAVARELRADVERRVGRSVSEGAIVMALRRLPMARVAPVIGRGGSMAGGGPGAGGESAGGGPGLGGGVPGSGGGLSPAGLVAAETDMILRSNLIEVTYATSPTLFRAEGELLRLGAAAASFVTMTSGVRETTIVASADLAPAIRELFAAERVLGHVEDLSSITIRLPAAVLSTPGAYAQLLTLLAWQGINVVEVVSTYRELTLLLRREAADDAWRALRRALG